MYQNRSMSTGPGSWGCHLFQWKNAPGSHSWENRCLWSQTWGLRRGTWDSLPAFGPAQRICFPPPFCSRISLSLLPSLSLFSEKEKKTEGGVGKTCLLAICSVQAPCLVQYRRISFTHWRRKQPAVLLSKHTFCATAATRSRCLRAQT